MPETKRPESLRSKPLKTRWQKRWLDLEVTDPDIQRLADAVQKFCDSWWQNAPRKRLLILVGRTGCGKTHIARGVWCWASALAFERYRHFMCSEQSLPTVNFSEWCKIASPERTDDREFDSWLNAANKDSLFVLDDIGMETDRFKTGVPIARLCEFMNRRSGKFTLITTNEPSERWKDRWDARVEDRMLRDSVVIETSAPSFVDFATG